jgi:hypothetical protein
MNIRPVRIVIDTTGSDQHVEREDEREPEA